ncbi:integrase catalytic domain-containing protein [Trichonephila clavipes]|nr:integrase catalytic domain-containing protein [Trichonephila clavipes]
MEYERPLSAYVCPFCKGSFDRLENLNKHVQQIHSVRSSTKENHLCPLCGTRCLKIEGYRNHLRHIHGLNEEGQVVSFRCFNDFLVWKNELEKRNYCKYVMRTPPKKLASNDKLHIYHCDSSVGSMKEKKSGVAVKETCPAVISAIESSKTRNIKIEHWNNHVGHSIPIEEVELDTAIGVVIKHFGLTFPEFNKQLWFCALLVEYLVGKFVNRCCDKISLKMTLKLNLKKDELTLIAVEMGLVIPSKAGIIDLKKLIESSALYKNDIEFVRSLVENALEKSKQEAEKNEREAEIQLEKIKLSQIEKQLKLAKVRKESEKNPQTLESGEPSSITDKLEKKAFQIKFVPDELKAEILLNILGERVNNLLTYVSQEDFSNYVKIKGLILREFEPTPQECLSNFKKARKLPSENYVQFASRLSATFDYYCQLHKVNEFRSLCDLIISDKIFETLDRDTMNHIATKQGETYFKPQQLERECVYLSARGNVSNDLMSRNPGSGVKTDGRNRLQTVGTWRQERNSSNVFVAETKTNCVLCKGNNFHPLSKCYQFKKLSVEDRVEVVKRNNLCFRCFLPHRLKECHSEKNRFCLRPHNSLIHFSRD